MSVVDYGTGINSLRSPMLESKMESSLMTRNGALDNQVSGITSKIRLSKPSSTSNLLKPGRNDSQRNQMTNFKTQEDMESQMNGTNKDGFRTIADFTEKNGEPSIGELAITDK